MTVTINGTTGVTYPDGTLQTAGVAAPGTVGNVLTSTGTTWASTALPSNPPPFVAGTLMLFQQTAAPTGWTKQTTHNDKSLRVVSGTASSGGTTAFSTVFANQTPTFTGSIGSLAGGATTLSTAQMPSHSHSYSQTISIYPPGGLTEGNGPNSSQSADTGSTGGGTSHSHSISGTPGGTNGAVTLNVQYVDLIIASKD
jgi:hypothetical protein